MSALWNIHDRITRESSCLSYSEVERWINFTPLKVSWAQDKKSSYQGFVHCSIPNGTQFIKTGGGHFLREQSVFVPLESVFVFGQFMWEHKKKKREVSFSRAVNRLLSVWATVQSLGCREDKVTVTAGDCGLACSYKINNPHLAFTAWTHSILPFYPLLRAEVFKKQFQSKLN